MKKRYGTKIICMVMAIAMLLSGIYFPAAQAADETCPVIGDYENLTDLVDQEFSSGKNQDTIDLSGKVSGNTWYLSAVINFTQASTNGGPELVFATGTVNGTEGTMLRLQFRNAGSDMQWVLNSAKGASYTYGDALNGKAGGCNTGFATGKDYKVTIKVENGDKLIWWVNGKKVNELSLSENGATNLKAAIGWRNYSASGTMKNIQFWDGVTYKHPTIGNCKNLVPDSLAGNLTFKSGAENKETTELSKVSGTTWYMSQTLNFSTKRGNDLYETVVAVTGTINNDKTGKTVRIGVVPGSNYWEVRIKNEPIWQADSIKSKGVSSSMNLELNKDYTLTVQISDGDKLSFWVDGKNVLNGLSIKELYGAEAEWRPAFGYRCYGPQGTVSNIQVWDGVTMNYPTIGDRENLVPNSLAGTLTFAKNAENHATTELSKVSGKTWYISQTLNFTGTSTEFHETAVAVTGTINDGNTGKTVRIGIVPGLNHWKITVGKEPIYNGTTQIASGTSDVTIQAGKDYVLTAAVVDGDKVSFWIDGTPVASGISLKNKGYEAEWRPAFGYRDYGKGGTCRNIQVWDDSKESEGSGGSGEPDEPVVSDCPKIGDCSNLIPEVTETEFKPGINKDLISLAKRIQGNTWYFSTTLNFTEAGTNSGPEFAIATGTFKDVDGTMLRLQIRNGGSELVWVLNPAKGPMYTYGDAIASGGCSVAFKTGTDYLVTIKVDNGDKLSLWINEKKIVNELSLAEKGAKNLKASIGWRNYGASGTLKNLQMWDGVTKDYDGERPVARPEGVENLVLRTEEFSTFVSQHKKYMYDTEKIGVQGDSWYFSGKFVYDGMPGYGGLTFCFAEGTYTEKATNTKAAVTGTKEIYVTARSGGFTGEVRNTQTVLWVESTAVHAGSVAGFSYEIGKEYTWAVEVEEGVLRFWIDDILVYADVALADYGITDLKPKFGLLSDGSNGKVYDVEIWDPTITDVKPVAGASEANQAVITEVNVTSDMDQMIYDGLSYTDGGEYYYAADVNGKNIRLVVAKAGDAAIEVYYDGTAAYIVKNSNGKDTEIAKATVDAGSAEEYNCIVKYNDGVVSVWINDNLVLSKVAVEGATASAGIDANGAKGSVTDIRLWGATAQTGEAFYQKFTDISAYRGKNKTYPKANGYVFGGWYQDEDENKPVSESTMSGTAYAKMVPASVLSVKTQILKDSTYASAKTNLRFVTAVDSLKYKEIHITLSSDGKTRCFAGRDVYKSVKVTDGEASSYNLPGKIFGSDAAYFFTVNMKNVNAFDQVWTAVPGWITLDGTKVEGIATEVAVNDMFNKRITQEKLGLNGSTLLQIASGTTKTDIMSYVIKTKDNKVIVIDGGTADDADYLVWVLKNRYGVSNVEAWYLTHEDAAHCGALESILTSGAIAVNHVYYNFLSSSQSDLKTLLNKTDCAQEVSKVTHTYGDVKIQVVNDSNTYAAVCNGSADSASMVLLAEFGGSENKGVLFLGDLTSTTEACVLKQAQDGGLSLKGKIVQIAGGSKAFYENLAPSVCLWPVTKQETWDNNSELRAFLTEKGAAGHYSALHGSYEFY